MFEYKCMHVFSKTKCIFKYKCMHAYARGYGSHRNCCTGRLKLRHLNFFSNPYNESKYHLAFPEIDLISYRFRTQFVHKAVSTKKQHFINSVPTPIHLQPLRRSRIATAICGLKWVKITMVNSGLKGLIFNFTG